MSAERTLVIGSGMAGLSAAAVLAHCGRQVTVLEAAPVSAPLLRGFTRRGLRCDVGLHYSGGLGPGGLVRRVLSSLGAQGVEVNPLDPRGFDRIVWPDRAIDLALPVGLDAVEATMAEVFSSSLRAVKAYLDVVRSVLAGTPYLNPELSPEQWPRNPYDRVSLEAFLRGENAGDDLVDFLDRYGAMLFGMNARETPLSTHAIVLGSYFVSAHTIHGGGEALADALVGRISVHGGRVETGRQVSSIVLCDAGVAGVELADGERLTADSVVFTPHPMWLPRLLAGTAVGESYGQRVVRVEDTPPMLVAFLDHPPPEDRNAYLFFDRSAAPGDECRHLGVMAGAPAAPSGRPGALCLIRDAGSLGRLPAAGQTGVPSRPAGYGEYKLRLVQDAMQHAAHYLGMPHAGCEIVEITSPVSFAEWTGSRGGAAYGMKRPVRGRRLNALTPVPGLYLAGQSILCPGIMGALASALVAAGHIVGHERVWREVLPC